MLEPHFVAKASRSRATAEIAERTRALGHGGSLRAAYDSAGASGAPHVATGNVFTCVCHCVESWKNFTPFSSVPSIYTVRQKYIYQLTTKKNVITIGACEKLLFMFSTED